MRNISDTFCRENQETFFSANFFENGAVYELMRTNVVEWGRSQMMIRCMHIAYWIPKATNTSSEYVVLIAFFYYNNGCTNAPQCHFILRGLEI